MGIDTVTLRSPAIDEELACRLERLSILKQGLDLATGEELWAITSGQLDGSYDARISFRVVREDWVSGPDGVPHLAPCAPFVLTEASWAKCFHGQNVYGVVDHFQHAAELYIEILQVLLGLNDDELPYAKHWEVRRVDWAEMFALPPSAVTDFFRCFNSCKFPRRSKNTSKHGDHSMHFPGSSTTLRLYYKGAEFKEHDFSRLRRALFGFWSDKSILQAIDSAMTARKAAEAAGLDEAAQKRAYIDTYNTTLTPTEELYKLRDRKIKALQRLANNRLRCEVQINAAKLEYDFKEQLTLEGKGRRFPKVSEITDEYLINIYQKEMFKLIKEGATEMETVRSNDAVSDRLVSIYGKRAANSLYTFWVNMAGLGEDKTKAKYSESQFYANRKKLIDAGVSWMASNIYILPPQSLLPVDFRPLRDSSRIAKLPIRFNSSFNICPTEYKRVSDALAARRAA